MMETHPKHATPGPASPARGIAMAILATISYSLADAASKYQAREYPVEMIVWARYAVPLFLLLLVFLPRLGRGMLRTAYPGLQLVRGLLATAGTLFIIFAYRGMPLADAQAISFIHPVLLTLLAVIFLGERVNRLGWVAVLLGFSGVLLIVRPGGELFTPVALLPLGLALSFSSYQILTRILTRKEASINSLFYILLIGSLIMTSILPFVWVSPTPRGLLVFAFLGAASGIGNFLTIKSLEYAPASLIAPFAYIQLLWISILGIVVFGDFPDLYTLIGMAVIVASGLLVSASRRAPKPG
jgi:drug/metabolite transporter (DMT)-like permease